jgi:hypothetical protein
MALQDPNFYRLVTERGSASELFAAAEAIDRTTNSLRPEAK